MINRLTYQEVIDLEVDKSINLDLFHLSLLVKSIFTFLCIISSLLPSILASYIFHEDLCGW